MFNAKIGKLPEHIWTDSFSIEKSNLEKLTSEQIAIATNKGYTVS